MMESEFLYPTLADRSSPGAWEEAGHKNIYEAAHARVQRLLADYYPEYIDPATDVRIRKHFPIRLSREDMRRGNSRW
jgi:trimethylamine--corrinoid protein Co-methyltransferase